MSGKKERKSLFPYQSSGLQFTQSNIRRCKINDVGLSRTDEPFNTRLPLDQHANEVATTDT
jgi:hypothetical protein